MPEDTAISLLRQSADLRKSKFLSQKQVGELLGHSTHGNISLLEQGRVMPRLDRFLKILDVYGYTLQIIEK